MKKNKDIEVRVEQAKTNSKGQPANVQQVIVGKKVIGEVEELENGKITVTVTGESSQHVRNVDEGIESLIRHWNLHQ